MGPSGVGVGLRGTMGRVDRRVVAALAALAVAAATVVGCVRAGAATPEGTVSPAIAPSSNAVVIAFAGDVHFEGSSATALTDGLGSAAAVLKSADLAVVNLETAVTTRGTPEPKQFTFRAPPSAFTALKAGGVDVVTMANNHGMDYGRLGLKDSLAAAKARDFPVIGAGPDDKAAYAPLRRTVKGVRISVFAATDVLDSFAVTTWPATPTRAGLVTVKGAGLARLVRAVTAERSRSDVIAVDLHWGVERNLCPTARQKEVARALSAAGADIVVGSHAHVLQPQTKIGRTTVHYGLGNFIFYARSGAAIQTGVLTVTVSGTGVRSTAWHPAVISGGRPRLLTGAAKDAALRAQRNRGSGC